MVILRKNYPLYFLNIRRVYPTAKGLVVTFPIDKMFNIVLILCAHYFIYLKLSFRQYSDFNKLVIVKLPFDTTILQVRQFINRFGTRKINFTTRNISVENVCS